MIKFKYENIDCEFTYVKPNEESLGSHTIIFPKELISEYLEENEEIDLEFYTSIEELKELVEDEEDFETQDIDFQIILFYFLFYETDNSYSIKIYGSNPYWILHDFCHAEKDVVSYSIYVDADTEEERLLDGIRLAKKLNMVHHINGELLDNISVGHKERWNLPFDYSRALKILNNE